MHPALFNSARNGTVALLTLIVFVLAPSAASAASDDRCGAGGRTLMASADVRVAVPAERAGAALTACLLSNGRPVVVGRYGLCSDGGGARPLAVAGHYAAFGVASCGTDGKRDVVELYDVRTKQLVLRRDAIERPGTPDVGLDALVLSRTGAVAWTAHDGGAVRAVSARPRGDVVALDDAGDVAPRSVALAEDGTAYWTAGGVARATALDTGGAGAPFGIASRGARIASRTCPASGPTLAATPGVRVYSRGRDATDPVFACLASLGRRVRLDRFGDCAGGAQTRPLAITAPMLAVNPLRCRAAGDGSLDRMQVWDLRSGERLVDSEATVAKGRRGAAARWVRIGAVVLRPGGAVVWTASGERDPDQIVSARAGDAPVVLESGAQVATRSLAGAPDGTVYWRSGRSGVRTTRLR